MAKICPIKRIDRAKMIDATGEVTLPQCFFGTEVVANWVRRRLLSGNKTWQWEIREPIDNILFIDALRGKSWMMAFPLPWFFIRITTATIFVALTAPQSLPTTASSPSYLLLTTGHFWVHIHLPLILIDLASIGDQHKAARPWNSNEAVFVIRPQMYAVLYCHSVPTLHCFLSSQDSKRLCGSTHVLLV